MKLEKTLIELTTLVDLGAELLKSCNQENVLSKLDADYVLNYVVEHDFYNLVHYIANNFELDEIFPDKDIKDYVRNHYYIHEIYNDDTILDFARNSFDFETLVDLEDMVEIVKDCYSADEVYDMDVETILGNASLDDFLEAHRDIDDEEILSTMSPETICEYIDRTYGADELLETVDLTTIRNYISDHYDLDDFIEWI